MVKALLFYMAILAAAPANKIHKAIDQARQKVLEKNRKEASQLLLGAIAEEHNEPKKAELKSELVRLSTLFMTNEGQRLFELAESIRFSGETNYMSKYEEALQLEDLNWNILISQSVGWLRQKECMKAKESLQLADEILPDTEEVQILKISVQLCEDPNNVPVQTFDSLRIKKHELFKRKLKACALVQGGQRESGLAVARDTIAMDSKYPSGYYWAWAAIKDEENVGLNEAQSYLSLCKELTAAQRRMYALDPELCLDTTSVEKFIKKVESQSQ
ncbi:MAG: hypothetical protein KDD38_01810 [Bdellovibrionales bacterium]|nr:hypothetical protein [Bdellovibrionales bacterium]